MQKTENRKKEVERGNSIFFRKIELTAEITGKIKMIWGNFRMIGYLQKSISQSDDFCVRFLFSVFCILPTPTIIIKMRETEFN